MSDPHDDRALIPAGAGAMTPALEEKLRGILHAAKAPDTWRVYRQEWAHFESWVAAVPNRGSALPADPTTIIAYLLDLAACRKLAGRRRAVASIAQVHKAAGHASPVADPRVKAVLAGMGRANKEPQKKAAAVRLIDLTRMVALLGEEPSLTTRRMAAVLGPFDAPIPASFSPVKNMRDRALLLIGWFGGFRRSELVGLRVEDVRFVERGVILGYRGKTTKGKTREKAIGHAPEGATFPCPVKALHAWMDGVNGIVLEEGGAQLSPFVFPAVSRTGTIRAMAVAATTLSTLVKRLAHELQLEGNFSGHSLRAGLVTELALSGFSDRQIMQQSHHATVQQIGNYTREAHMFENDIVGELARKR